MNKIDELKKERDRWYGAAQERQIRINELEQQVANLEEYMLKGVAFRDELQAEIARLKEAKDLAYKERNRLVLFLTRCFLSHRCRHPESDTSWERDWTNIICVHGPQGQMAWHIHDSELPMFEHLRFEESHWDGHTTDEKYQRLFRCDMNSSAIADVQNENAHLRAIASRVEDVEGMAKIIASDVCGDTGCADDYWRRIPAGVQVDWLDTARAVSAWLKEGK